MLFFINDIILKRILESKENGMESAEKEEV